MQKMEIFVTFDAAEEGGIREAQLVTADGQREELGVTTFDDAECVEVELSAADEVVATYFWDESAKAVKDLEATADGAIVSFENAGRAKIAVNGCLLRSGKRGEIAPVDLDVALRAAVQMWRSAPQA